MHSSWLLSSQGNRLLSQHSEQTQSSFLLDSTIENMTMEVKIEISATSTTRQWRSFGLDGFRYRQALVKQPPNTPPHTPTCDQSATCNNRSARRTNQYENKQAQRDLVRLGLILVAAAAQGDEAIRAQNIPPIMVIDAVAAQKQLETAPRCEIADRNKLRVNVDSIVADIIRHMSLGLQKEDVSSSANKTPPTGAPNAAAKPAAVPIETKSRRSRSLRNRRSHRALQVMVWFVNGMWNFLRPYVRIPPTIAPMCTRGPSGPTTRHDATERIVPNTLTRKHLNLSIPGTLPTQRGEAMKQ